MTMLIDASRFDWCYKQIKDSVISIGSSVLIFASTEVDSVCALQILTNIFKQDSINHTYFPVDGFEHLQRVNKQLVSENDEVKSVILINCGAVADLTPLLISDEESFSMRSDLQYYIIDHCRPIHLNNIYDRNHISVLVCDEADGSEDTKQEIYPDPKYENDDDNDMEDDSQPGEGKAQELMRRRQKRRQMMKRYDEYYRGLSHSISSAFVCFEMAQQRNRDDNDSLWCSIVAITNQYLCGQITQWQYNSLHAELASAVMKHNPVTINDDLHNIRVERLTQSGEITAIREYRLMLYRHWTLYDSLYNSEYIASRLRIWTDEGKTKLKNLLARVGLPLHLCKGPFRFMPERLQREFLISCEPQLSAWLPRMDDFHFESFQRQCGPHWFVTASDMAYSLSALLMLFGSEDSNEEWIGAFNQAVDSLGVRQYDLIEQGLSYMQQIQETIVRYLSNLLQKKRIHRAEGFRYAIIDRVPEKDSVHLSKPGAIRRLARFIVEVDMARNNQRKSKLPFVLAVHQPLMQTYLIYGLPAMQADMIQGPKNTWLSTFQAAAAETNAQYKLDRFDSGFFEVAQESLPDFFEVLKTGLVAAPFGL